MQSCKLICFGFRKQEQTRCNNPKAERQKLRTFAVPNGCNMNKTKHKRGFDLLHKGTKIYDKQECFANYFHCKTNLFLCLQHVENKGFQTVIKHRLKAIQKPIKNELGNREKKHKKCTFRFGKMHISFSRLYNYDTRYIYILRLGRWLM